MHVGPSDAARWTVRRICSAQRVSVLWLCACRPTRRRTVQCSTSDRPTCCSRGLSFVLLSAAVVRCYVGPSDVPRWTVRCSSRPAFWSCSSFCSCRPTPRRSVRRTTSDRPTLLWLCSMVDSTLCCSCPTRVIGLRRTVRRFQPDCPTL